MLSPNGRGADEVVYTSEPPTHLPQGDWRSSCWKTRQGAANRSEVLKLLLRRLTAESDAWASNVTQQVGRGWDRGEGAMRSVDAQLSYPVSSFADTHKTGSVLWPQGNG